MDTRQSPPPIKVDLDWQQLEDACCVGMLRRIDSLKRGYQERHGAGSEGYRDPWGININGAIGELAVCVGLGVDWDGSINNLVGPDIPNTNWQVRWKRRGYDGCKFGMIIRPKDRDDDIFISVYGGPRHFVVEGWLLGSECKNGDFVGNPGGYGKCWVIPDWAMNDIRTIPRRGVAAVTQ